MALADRVTKMAFAVPAGWVQISTSPRFHKYDDVRERSKALNNDIGNKLTNNLIVIANNNRRLRLRLDTFFSKFNHQAFLIDGFQEPKAQLVVDTVCAPDDLLGEFFIFHCQYVQQSVIYRIHVNSHDNILSILSKDKKTRHRTNETEYWWPARVSYVAEGGADAIFAQLAAALEDGLLEDEELA